MRRRTKARAGRSAKAPSKSSARVRKARPAGEKPVAPKRKKSRLKNAALKSSGRLKLKSGRQKLKSGRQRKQDSSPALEPIRRKKKKVIREEDTLSSSMEEALGWMAGVEAPAKQKRIGPARNDTRRIAREDAAKKDPKRRTRKIKRPPAEPKQENAFSWMDELAGPFPDVQLAPCDPDQRRGQPTPAPRKIPAAAKGKTRRVPRESKAPTQRVQRPRPEAAEPVTRQRPKPQPVRAKQPRPQPKPARRPKPAQEPQTARWGDASSDPRPKLPQRRPTGRIGPPLDPQDHLGDRPITAELSESEIRMLGMPPEVALRQPRRKRPRPAPRPASPTESLGEEALEQRLSRLANTLDPPPARRPQRGLLEISDSGPVIVDPTRPRSSEEMRRTLRLDPLEAADCRRGTPASEAPTRKALPAVTPAAPPLGLESRAWDESSSLVPPLADDPFADDPFANDPFADDPFENEPAVSDSSLFELEDPYLMAAIDPTKSDPFDEEIQLTSSSKDVFPDPPEYRAPGCGDPFCLDPHCSGDPFAFQVRAAELQDTQNQKPLPPVTDRRRRLRRGA